jgi:hypothetical protein
MKLLGRNMSSSTRYDTVIIRRLALLGLLLIGVSFLVNAYSACFYHGNNCLFDGRTPVRFSLILFSVLFVTSITAMAQIGPQEYRNKNEDR